MNRQKLKIQGVGIQIEDSETTAQSVLFIHYGGSNLRMWDHVLPFFNDSYRCITVDLRGHGKSDAPETGYHIDDMADDLVGVLDALGIHQAHVIGSSIGAEVGLSLAARYPHRMLSLVADGALASEYGPYGSREADSVEQDEEVASMLAKRKAAPELIYTSREEAMKRSSKFYKECNFWNPTVEAMLTYNLVTNEQGAIVNAWRKHASDAYMSIYFTLRFEAYYEHVTCPMIMLPEQDDMEDSSMLDIMARLCTLAKDCEIVQVPGHIHPFGWMLSPEPVARAVLEFYRGRPKASQQASLL